jgi:NAD(P)-dependent dehydrogenase (short-subunit alcohol dehydrogenase family)
MTSARVIVISGASSGFGQQAARLLVARGHRVYGTSRQVRPDDEGVRMLALDVRDDRSVRIAVETVLAEAGRIDVLVNNAGYALASLVEEATTDEAIAQFDTNFFGLVRMTKAVLPAMRRQRSGTIINVSSLAGLVGVPGEGFYAATKFAIEGYSESLRYEVAPFGIHVCIVEPSYFRTGFDGAKTRGSDRIDDYNGIRERIDATFENGLRHGGHPRTVGELIARIATSPRPRLRYRVGREARLLAPLRHLLPEALFAWGARKSFGIPGFDQAGRTARKP